MSDKYEGNTCNKCSLYDRCISELWPPCNMHLAIVRGTVFSYDGDEWPYGSFVDIGECLKVKQ